MHFTPYQLAAPAAVLACAVCPAQEQAVVEVRDQASFNAALTEAVMQGKSRFTYKPTADCPVAPKKLMRYSNWYDYAIAYKIIDDGTLYTAKLTIKDSTRMLAAHHNPELRAKLSKRERAALGCMEERLSKLITPSMTEAQKVLAIHDDLVNRVTYNIKSGGECTTILLTDSGLCEAYARYMFLALKISGIDCRIVLGKAGCPHAWNMVKIGGRWSHIDATWDDPISATPALKHDYFCIPDRVIAKDHHWNTKAFPEAKQLDNAYFKRQGRCFKDYKSFWKAVADSYKAGDATYEAKLLPLAKEGADFAKALRGFSAKNPDVRVEFFSQAYSDPCIVFLTFLPKEDKRRDVQPSRKEDAHPSADEKSAFTWLDPALWKDLCPEFDSDLLLEEGRKLLDDTEKKGKELLEEGADRLKQLEDAWF